MELQCSYNFEQIDIGVGIAYFKFTRLFVAIY